MLRLVSRQLVSSFAMLALATVIAAKPALAQTLREQGAVCQNTDNAHAVAAQVEACTRIIQASGNDRPLRAAAFHRRAAAYYGQHDYARAIADYDEAIRLDPRAEIFNNRGAAYNAMGDTVRAVADFDQAIRLRPRTASYFYNRGNSHAKLRDYTRAIADFDSAIALDPNFAQAFYNRALAYSEQGDSVRAIADYDSAIRLSSSFAEAFYGRGLQYAVQGDHTRAWADFDRSIRLDPTKAWFFHQRGVAYLVGFSDPVRAIADLNEAIRLDPGFGSAFSSRARAHAGRGEFPRAVADLDTALRMEPENAQWLQNRCLVQVLWGQHLDLALADCNASLQIAPNTELTLNTRGLVHLRRRNFQAAFNDYDAALRLSADRASSHYGRGLARVRLGQSVEGRADIAGATQRDPNVAAEFAAYGLSR